MDDYAYFNTRIRAMQSRLLTQERYEVLLAQDTTAAFLERLMDTPYAEALERAAEAPDASARRDTTIRIDEAFRRDLAATLLKLQRLVSDRLMELMGALLLRWDAYNLKTILRGKRASAPIEELLASTFPVGVLDEIALAELTRAPSVGALVNTLATWRMPFARPLRERLRLLGEAAPLQVLEFELDRFAFAQALRVVADGDDNDNLVREYLRLLVDRANLLTALRFLNERSALSPVEAGRHFLEADGRFTHAHYEAVVGARDLRHGLSLLADTPYHWLTETFTESEPVSLPLVERRLDHGLIHEALAPSRIDPLGIGLLVIYLERKVNEVRNLRMILRGKVLGMGADEIKEWLII
ncbi:MAG: V-type ATPase subunit [Nitrospirae bacterium]|nr:V-type ATPase subunit [Nitrospirota bacterium]